MDGIHTGAEIWHIAVAVVGFYGLVYRTWIVPQRREREDLIRWRKDQESMDAAHETRMAAIEDRLGKGDDKFERIMSELAKLRDGQTRIETKLDEHRKACEKA